MLVILFGPSGVGKTSLSRLLERDAGYHALMTYTTRLPRVDEDDRKSLSENEYDDAVSSKQIVSTSHAFGFRYGLNRAQLEESLNDLEKVYLVDFALENLADIDTFRGHKIGVLVLPPDLDELERRLTGRGQANRVQAALGQYRYCQELNESGLPALIDGRVVINRSLGETAHRIQEMIERATLHGGGSISRTGSFLTDTQIMRALRGGEIFDRDTWSVESVHQASYGLRIDGEAQVSAAAVEAETGKRSYLHVKARDGFIELSPGDTALLQSVERFNLHPRILGLVVPRGLLVANSLAPGSSYVDPGYKGFFTMPVTNVSGRVVQLPVGTEAARVMFAELDHVVGRPWSAADATSLKSELTATPGSPIVSRSQLRSMRSPALTARIRSESPLGKEMAEALDRGRRERLIILSLAVIWPIALIIVNEDSVRVHFAGVFSGASAVAGNVVAGLITTLAAFVINWFVKQREDNRAERG